VATLLNKRTNIMTTKQLHFKWTVSRGRDTYGYNICTLLVDGEKVGKTCGGGYDMQGTAFAEWLQGEYQAELIRLNNDKGINVRIPDNTYETSKGVIRRYSLPGFYGMSLHVNPDSSVKVYLDGGCGMESMKTIAEALGITLKWNPESDKYKNHTYYTAIIN
jgi:hypothetical protein